MSPKPSVPGQSAAGLPRHDAESSMTEYIPADPVEPPEADTSLRRPSRVLHRGPSHAPRRSGGPSFALRRGPGSSPAVRDEPLRAGQRRRGNTLTIGLASVSADLQRDLGAKRHVDPPARSRPASWPGYAPSVTRAFSPAGTRAGAKWPPPPDPTRGPPADVDAPRRMFLRSAPIFAPTTVREQSAVGNPGYAPRRGGQSVLSRASAHASEPARPPPTAGGGGRQRDGSPVGQPPGRPRTRAGMSAVRTACMSSTSKTRTDRDWTAPLTGA